MDTPISNAKIYVIAGDETDRRILETVLEREMCKVHSIGFVREILKTYEDNKPFDLILLNFSEQTASGIKVMRALRKIAPGIPICAICNTLDTSLLRETKASGATYVINKTYSDQSILSIVRSVSGRDRRADIRTPGSPRRD